MTDLIAAARAMIEPLTGDTPGPWDASGLTVYDTCMDGVASCHAGADARLIATAPDLRDMVATLADALEAERAEVAAAYEAAATLSEASAERNKTCPSGCRCADGWHIAMRIRSLTPADAESALDKLLAEARAMESKRADNLMRERDDALMRLGSLTERLASLAEAKDHTDGEPETDFDRGYDQAGDEIAAMIRDTEHNAQIIVREMLAEARLEGWRAGRDAATEPLTSLAAVLRKSENSYHQSQASAMLERADAIRALPEPREASHD